jgi:hypothetical protein
LLALAACSTPAPDMPAPQTIEEVRVEPPARSSPPGPPVDICRAGELQWLVGKPRTQIPVPVNVVNRRVTCTTCPITQDFVPGRLNIFFNDQSGLGEQVRCG